MTPFGRAPMRVLLLVTGLIASALFVTPASADEFPPAPTSPPPSQPGPVRETVKPKPRPPTAGASAPAAPAPESTCRIYGSSSGFGLLCSHGVGGKSLAQLLDEAGIDTTRKFCWDDRDLPDGFQAPAPTTGAGRWWLRTCLSFDGAVTRDNADLTYEFVFHTPGAEDELNDTQAAVITLVTGRGQMPFLQVQTSPIASPRVGQDVAFSLLCDSSKLDCSRSDQGFISTSKLDVGGVTMHAELVHLRVRPEGAARSETIDCNGAGLARTAEQLATGAQDDPRVCRYSYDQSSDGAGGGASGDRFPAEVTAYWQIYYDDGTGPRPLGATYEKTSISQVRVTEVQTLVVS